MGITLVLAFCAVAAAPVDDDERVPIAVSAAIGAVAGGIAGGGLSYSVVGVPDASAIVIGSGLGAAVAGGTAALVMGRFADAPFVAMLAAVGVPAGIYGLYVSASFFLAVPLGAIVFLAVAGSDGPLPSVFNFAALAAAGAIGGFFAAGAAAGAAGGALAGLEARENIWPTAREPATDPTPTPTPTPTDATPADDALAPSSSPGDAAP